MSLFENLSKKVSDTAKAAAKKSSELVEVTKLNMAIGTEEEKIEKAYAAMGKSVYELYSAGEEINGEFIDYCEKIKLYEQNISDMKQKIMDLKNVKVCTSCGAELEAEVAFCPKCGAKQEIPEHKEQPQQEPSEKTCPGCGAVNTPEAAFCCKCGTRL